MKQRPSLYAICFATLLHGCAVTPIAIDNLKYRGTTTTKSTLSARVQLQSSGVGGTTSTTLMPAGGILIPIANRSNEMPFRPKEQHEFLQSLQNELVRLGVVRSANESVSEATDLDIRITIDSARFNFDRVEYVIEMTMNLSSNRTPPSQRKYKVVSTEKDKGLEGWSTNGAQAREKLAHLMLERLVPDIEAFTAAMLSR